MGFLHLLLACRVMQLQLGQKLETANVQLEQQKQVQQQQQQDIRRLETDLAAAKSKAAEAAAAAASAASAAENAALEAPAAAAAAAAAAMAEIENLRNVVKDLKDNEQMAREAAAAEVLLPQFCPAHYCCSFSFSCSSGAASGGTA